MDSKLLDKLTVLGDAAKYDASCSSSGSDRSNVGRIGSAACAGICHSWTADGRCMSLLKVLFSNDCVYDCRYCTSRRSADAVRCTFEPRELADITIEFYRRNYIEGLFLSSAVFVSPDHTAERMFECLRLLRTEYGFAGYIHAKVIPGVSNEVLQKLGLVADRLSVNIEFPSSESLGLLAPQKKAKGIFSSMRLITQTQAEQKTLKMPGFMGKDAGGVQIRKPDTGLPAVRAVTGIQSKFAPAGQTTQMIVGASGESDLHIIKTSEAIYRRFAMKRVYFSAYIPVVNDEVLPALGSRPQLKREHRLYQADWLLRFYGFEANEILSEDAPNLDTELDPKAAWAVRHIDMFPVEINKASVEELMRVPGVGYISATRIVRQRRVAAVKYDDLTKMGVAVKRARYFITCSGRYYGDNVLEPYYIRDKLKETEALSAQGQSVPLLDPAEVRRKLAGGGSAQISMFDELSQGRGLLA
jgi:putative DNA modification/repair radical SAM protein